MPVCMYTFTVTTYKRGIAYNSQLIKIRGHFKKVGEKTESIELILV